MAHSRDDSRWNWCGSFLLSHFAAISAIVLVGSGCGRVAGDSDTVAGRIIKFNKDASTKYPTSWKIKIVSPSGRAHFRINELISCEFTVESEEESLLPLTLGASIKKSGRLCVNSPRAAKVGASPPIFVFRTTLCAPNRKGIYQLQITATDRWWHEKANGRLNSRPEQVFFTSEPIKIEVNDK
jgi:hypothetical protein